MTHFRIELDLLHGAVAAGRRLQRILLAAGVLGLVAVTVSTLFVHRLRTRDEQTLAGRTAEQTPRKPSAPIAHDPAFEHAYKQANAALDQLSLPWEELFQALETAGADQLGLLGLAPDAESRSLRISGEGPSLEAVLAYIDRLGQQPILTEVHLVSYALVDRPGASGITFTIQARWKR